MQAEVHAIASWEQPAESPTALESGPVRPLEVFPDRYRVTRERKASILTCTEAPTLRVHIERGLSITAAEEDHFAHFPRQILPWRFERKPHIPGKGFQHPHSPRRPRRPRPGRKSSS